MLFVLLLTASVLLLGCSMKKEKADMNLERRKVEIESLTDSSEKKVITDKKEIEKLFRKWISGNAISSFRYSARENI